MLVKEAHGGGLAGHFGVHKTLEILQEHFFWPRMLAIVTHVLRQCATCRQAKSTFKHSLYTPQPVPLLPWEDFSMDVIMALRVEKIQSWWWLTGFQRWSILYLALRLMMCLGSQTYSSRKLLNCMGFLSEYPIGIPCFLVIFGALFGPDGEKIVVQYGLSSA